MRSRFMFLKAAFLSLSVGLLTSQPVISQDATQPPSNLVQAAAEMQKYLDAMPEPHQSDWKLYLDWEKWGPQLAAGKSPAPETLQEIHSRFYAVYDGLDHPTFLDVRNRLRNFLLGSPAEAQPGGHPGLLIRFNQRLITTELDKLARSRVDQRQTGNWIAGAWVTGTAISQAHVSGRLVPFGEAAAVEVRVQGLVDSPHTIAHNGSFQVHGSAKSQFDGVAYLYLDKDIIRMTEPKFSVQTNSQLSHVDGPRLFKGIALRKAHKRQGQGESEGEAIIASKASQELKNDLARQINLANQPFSDEGPYHVLLIRTDLVPTLITTGLSAATVQVGLRFPGGAAVHAPPKRELSSEDDFEIALHESIATAFTANFLRGSWWTDQSFTRVQRELTGGNTNEMLIGATPQRWGARWDWARPLSAKITEEAIEYQLTFAQAQIDGKTIEEGLVVRARYRPSAPRWGLEFRRVGAVEVSAQKAGHQLPPDVAEFFTRKFSALFDETVYLDGLSPPAGGGWDGLAAYMIAGVTLEDGWFAIQCRKAAK
jgi:hypothetical protein